MNYYPRHIGDYAKDASHLTLQQHGAYCRLMDVYYAREAAIPDDEAETLVGARNAQERFAVRAVLAQFFSLSDGVWTQKRCESEIKRYRKLARIARKNGKKGGRPSKTQRVPSGFREKTQPGTQRDAAPKPSGKAPKSQEPRANNQQQQGAAAAAAPPPELLAVGVSPTTAATLAATHPAEILAALAERLADLRDAEGLDNPDGAALALAAGGVSRRQAKPPPKPPPDHAAAYRVAQQKSADQLAKLRECHDRKPDDGPAAA